MGKLKNGKNREPGFVDESKRKKIRQEIKIGLFLGIGLAILAVFIFMVGDISTLFEKEGYLLYTHFDSVAGLERKTIVRMAGVKVGAVEAIILKENRAEVAMTIHPEIQISRDSKATLASLGLLGEKYIEISPGTEKTSVQPGGTIGSLPPVSFDQLGIILSSVGDDIKSTSKAMRELLGEGEARVNIKEILQNLSTVSADLKALISESKPNITQSLEKSADAIETFDKSVREIAKNLDELILLLKDTVDENRGTLKGNLEELDDLIQRAENTIEKFDDELEKIRKQEGTLGKLVHDASLYQEAEKIVSRVQDIVSPVSSFRWDLGLRTEYFAKSEFFKGTLSLGFWPASDKFLLAQVVSDPWQDKFTLSAQGGFRLGFFAPRAGILESKIGIGLDLYTFKDRVIFSLEGFDFNRDPGPHFRAWTSLVASEYIHFLLGVSDFTLAKNREIYFGLRFGF